MIMPSRFPKVTPTKVIHKDTWQDGETVTIRTFLGGFDLERISSAGQSLERAEDGKMEMRPRLHDRRQTELEVGITAWTFYWLKDELYPEGDRELIPLTPENIQALPVEDRDWIGARLNEACSAWGVKPASVTAPEPVQRAEVRAADAAFQPGAVDGPGGAATR